MLKSINSYLRDDVRPRLKSIFQGAEFWISFTFSLIVFMWCGNSNLLTIKNGDLGVLFLTYAAIALGFTLTGMTIVLTLPEREFANKLVTSKLEGREKDAYSDLLFVFSWTAIVHWILLFSVILFLAYFGFDNHILEVTLISIKRKFVVALLSFEIIYCLCQFLITVITLTQVGNLYIGFLQNKGTKK